MEWDSIARLDVLKVAIPPDSVSVASGVMPSKKLTEPAGAPMTELTVAVKVTLWPGAAGLAELANVVVVGVMVDKFTVSVTVMSSKSFTGTVVCGGGPGGVLAPEPFSGMDCV